MTTTAEESASTGLVVPAVQQQQQQQQEQQSPPPPATTPSTVIRDPANPSNADVSSNMTQLTASSQAPELRLMQEQAERVEVDEDQCFYYDDEEEEDDIDDDYDYYDDDNEPLTGSSKLEQRMNLSHSVANSVTQMQHLETTKRTLYQGRDDRATSEQVMDPKTRLVLFKLLSRGYLQALDGCLSTGKEANVYYAKAGPKNDTSVTEFAVKIYKTSILVFKDRDKYVTGEHRWRQGYCKSNPRKMVKLWAEKELRNYRRIFSAGIPCPQPILLQQHVLLMEFLGQDGWPSPRLKDAQLSDRHFRQAYVQTVLILRHLYQRCKLVHGDFSEYNLLWHLNQVYVIDVSQSVETDHPLALDFLRRDAAHVNDYFGTRLSVMSTRQLFDFCIADLGLESTATRSEQDAAEWERLEQLMHEVEAAATTSTDKVDDAVFMQSFLPRSLNQVEDVDIARLEAGEAEDLYAQTVASMTSAPSCRSNDASARVNVNAGDREDSVLDDDEEDSSKSANSSEDEDDDSSQVFCKVPKTPEELQADREAKKAERKANKKLVKEAQSERRLTKIKKKDKKRAIKKSKAGNRQNK